MKKLALAALLLAALLNSAFAQAFTHPRDQIALQLGAIQMGYKVPFALATRNSTNAQQAANALAMGRNALDATVAKPAVKVQGFLNSPNVDTLEYRDQLYQAVEAVVTAPVVGSIKGSATLVGGKKQSVTATLTLPPNSHTIPVPFAVEAATSVDTQQISTDVTNLTTQVSSMSGNLSSTINSMNSLTGNVSNLSTQVSSIGANSTATRTQVENLSYMKSALVAQGVVLDYAPCSVTALARFTDNDGLGEEGVMFRGLAGLELDGQGGVLLAANFDGGNEYGKILKVSSSGQVTVFAGNDLLAPIDGTGSAAGFFYPSASVVDASRNLYVSDANCIRKITPAGVVTTLAGSGSFGSADGTGSAASFNTIGSMVMDSGGNIYVADSSNYKIRKVTPSGVVSTLAGSGSYGSADGTGAAASFSTIGSMVMDSGGNLYVADNQNYKIRKVTPAGVVTTLAGSGSYGSADGIGSAASFSSISSMVMDSEGNVYVADSYSYKIRKVTPSGVVTTLAGSGVSGSANGTGASASFASPESMVLDGTGNLYVADVGNYRIRKVTPSGVVTTLAGSGELGSSDGVGSSASFGSLGTMVRDGSGNILVVDRTHHKIRKVTPSGVVTTLAGSGSSGSGDGTGSSASLEWIKSLALDSSGILLAVDNFGIRRISSAGVVTTLAGGKLPNDRDGSGTAARFGKIGAMASDSSGNLYVYDSTNYKIRKISSSGVVSSLAGSGNPGSDNGTGSAASFGDEITSMLVNASGTIYVADGSKIRKVTSAGLVTTLAGSDNQGANDGAGADASFGSFLRMGMDTAGNIYVADSDNYKLRKVTPSGIVTTLAGSGQGGSDDGTGPAASFRYISQPFIDESGNVYVGDMDDSDRGAIRKISPAGVVTTLAGSKSDSASDAAVDGPAKNARFGSINRLTFDGAGGLFVFESWRIRKLTADNRVMTLA